MEIVAFILFLAVICVLLFGYPVAFTLAGVSLIFAFAGILTGTFDPALLQAFPSRLFGIMNNETLIAVPLFVFMGVMLERSKIADELLDTMASLFGALRGGLGISVVLVGMLLAASTGIVGATVVTMGLLVTTYYVETRLPTRNFYWNHLCIWHTWDKSFHLRLF